MVQVYGLENLYTDTFEARKVSINNQLVKIYINLKLEAVCVYKLF